MFLTSVCRWCSGLTRVSDPATWLTLAIVAWCWIGAPVAAQPTYRVIEVAPSGTARDIDPTGTYVTGDAKSPGGQQLAFLWNAGPPVFLSPVVGADGVVRNSAGYGINASGQVVGHAYSATGAQVPYRWTAGTATPLQPFAAATSTIAYSVNAAGQAVGTGDTQVTAYAVAWAAGASAVTALPDPPDLWNATLAKAINASGDVVGWSEVFPCATGNGGICRRATRWSNGTVTTLAPPPGYRNSEATDINDAGQVVGRATVRGTDGFAAVPVLWSGGAIIVLDPSPYGRMVPSGINASGQIVGVRSGKAFLWQAGVTYDLAGLLDPSSIVVSMSEANAISDDGKIAVHACTSGTGARCFAAVLVPTPPAPPVPAYTRYLAEGATSGFFDTQIALLNPNTTVASASLQYLPASGGPITQAITVPARTRITINPKLVPGLANAEFSTVVQASQQLVVDRTMSWDGSGYGSHSETAVKSPATTWYLAEGATIGGFSLFYLLQNPAVTATTVRVRYLRTVGAPLEKTYVLPPRSRTNIWVNVEEFPGLGQVLAAAEFSAVIESQDGTPIIVERAMYRSNQGRVFNAGHESTGVSAPATDWFLAEGATGPFFDMFVLIANPTAVDAQVKVTYLTIDGTTFSRTFTASANARSGIWVDEEIFPGVAGKPLADAAVSTTVQSTNGVPLVVERAMWWPGDSSTWHEAHNSAGATATGTKWAVAEGEVGGARGHETYLLIANTSSSAGSATVTLLFEDGTSMARTYPLPPLSRTNVAVGPAFDGAVTDRRFGAVIESTGNTPAQIVVERAMYSGSFTAGTNALATRLQ
jgi:uncharacterized membrane protein